MRLLVVGAGASYAEGKEAGLPEDLLPPLISNFARQTWGDYNPHEFISGYLRRHGFRHGRDAREAFLVLEADPRNGINIESFFQYAYEHRQQRSYASAHPGSVSDYENLLHHGIFRPLTEKLCAGLLADGVDGARLPAHAAMASRFTPDDLVLNLNYDTLFELGAEVAGHSVCFLPNTPLAGQLRVAKPHGSINCLVSENGWTFFKPYFNTILPAGGWGNFFVPPRRGKKFSDEQISERIVSVVRDQRPDEIVFWGIGLTSSDADVAELMRELASRAGILDFLNPNDDAHQRAVDLFGRPVRRFRDHRHWLNAS
ncbi:MAG: hypothetical protein ABIQ30_08565 [Devosia sp.]